MIRRAVGLWTLLLVAAGPRKGQETAVIRANENREEGCMVLATLSELRSLAETQSPEEGAALGTALGSRRDLVDTAVGLTAQLLNRREIELRKAGRVEVVRGKPWLDWDRQNHTCPASAV